jgi:hypothetical protein
LELVLSTGQFLPERVDSVDHLAHVIGFASGVALALMLRFFQRWPGFLQTRAEFLYWVQLRRQLVVGEDLIQKGFRCWCELLDINPYNDQVKNHLCRLIAKHPLAWSPEQRERAFAFYSPTYVRLQTEAAAQSIAALLRNAVAPPGSWMLRMPYDSIIRLAQAMAQAPDNQPLLFDLVASYRRAHPEGSNTERKLELLMAKLSAYAPAVPPAPDRRQAP